MKSWVERWNKMKQDETRKNKMKQDETRQNKKKQKKQEKTNPYWEDLKSKKSPNKIKVFYALLASWVGTCWGGWMDGCVVWWGMGGGVGGMLTGDLLAGCLALRNVLKIRLFPSLAF